MNRQGRKCRDIRSRTRYLNKKANIVVDLGCGSGLSTTAWKNHCNAIIGIEPSDDMFLDRILKSGGIFAVVDYDWPPVCKWEAELAHKQLFYIVSRLEEEHEDLKDDYIRWDKNKHLSNIKNSGYFRYQREIVFANRESCDAKRFISMTLSQSGLQSIMKHKPDLIKSALDEYIETIQCLFAGEMMEADFCYRMRLGIK